MATMRGKSSSLLLWQEYSATYRPGICTTASPIAFERSRVNGHVSGAYCVWTEDFFDIEFGSFALPFSCGSSLRLRLRKHTNNYNKKSFLQENIRDETQLFNFLCWNLCLFNNFLFDFFVSGFGSDEAWCS